jgi:ribosomal protein L29
MKYCDLQKINKKVLQDYILRYKKKEFFLRLEGKAKKDTSAFKSIRRDIAKIKTIFNNS